MTLRGRLRGKITPLREISQLLAGKTFESCLDVGAGSGVILEMLYSHGVIRHGTGVEVNRRHFRVINRDLSIVGEEAIGASSFDLIIFSDVLHHVKDPAGLVGNYVSRFLNKGGYILVKEMNDTRPVYKYFNRLHDLLAAQQWIVEMPRRRLIEEVLEGYTVVKEGEKRLFLYDHYFVLFRDSRE